MERLWDLGDYCFLTTGDLNWDAPNAYSLNPKGTIFADLVASVDAVVSKPGFGILSDCVTNNKPILYVERENFREYPVLEAALKRHLKSLHIPLKKLRDADLKSTLDALQQGLPEPQERLDFDGAERVAHRLHEFLS